jgi:peroxiredoxin
MAALTVGERAPDFTLEGSAEGPVSLSDLLEGNRFVVLAFYPLAFSPVCTDQMDLYQEVIDEFERLGAKVVGISVDSKYAQQAFAKHSGIAAPLLADFHPKGAVAETYGVMRDDGVAERALFIIDSDGVIRYSYVSELTVNPGADLLFEALEGLQKKQP